MSWDDQDIYERSLDNEHTYDRDRKEYTKCNTCGIEKLKWKFNGRYWRLYDGSDLHICQFDFTIYHQAVYKAKTFKSATIKPIFVGSTKIYRVYRGLCTDSVQVFN